jgi:hypothetical protein
MSLIKVERSWNTEQQGLKSVRRQRTAINSSRQATNRADEIDNLTAEQERQRFGNREGLQLLEFLNELRDLPTKMKGLEEEITLLRDHQYEAEQEMNWKLFVHSVG